MLHRALFLCLMALGIAATTTVGADDPAQPLQNPTKLKAAGKAIDAYGAAPFIGDFKGDANLSLLVGTRDGKLHIYRNTSTDKNKFKFDNTFTVFQGGKAEASVPGSPEVGFTPQLVKRDSGTDILSGSASGALYRFRGKDKGNFGNGEVIKDKQGKNINLGPASTVFAFDWRGTGNLDLLVGSGDGYVWLVPNESTSGNNADSDQFGTPVKLEAVGKAIKVNMGHSHPIAADWDKDGKADLLVGTGAGSVLWFRNIGTAKEPKLDAPKTIVRESVLAANKTANLTANQWGVHAKIAVVDWNNTGYLDLLVGDGEIAAPPPPPLTPAQNTALQKAKNQWTTAQNEYNTAEQKVRQMEKAPAKESPAAAKEREGQLQNAKNQASRYQKEMQAAQAQITKLNPPATSGYHGNVWLFLRNPAN